MNRIERGCLHLSTLAMGLSGLAYGWLKYFGQRSGEFGPEPSPLQAWAQHAHVLLGPLLVFSLGLVVRAHVAPRLAAGGVRRAGFWLALVPAPLVLSGYGLQVVVDLRWRTCFQVLHGSMALLFLGGYALHLRRAATRAGAGSPDP